MPITNCEACGVLYEAWRDSLHYCPVCTKAGRITRWLIERGQSMNQTPTIWFKGAPDAQDRAEFYAEWTEDAWKATRFGTKEQAEEARDRIFGEDGAIVTEHVFILR